jgi:hypothetical protein
MEWVLKLLDDLDDLRAFIHAQRRPVIVALLLLAILVTVLTGVLVLGPQEPP